MADDLEKALNSIVSPLVKKIDNLAADVEHLKGGQATITGGNVLQPQPVRRGHFQVSDLTDTKEEVYCPTCGTTEVRNKPVVEKTVNKEVVKVEPPENWMPTPSRYDDIHKLIFDMEHPDGKHLLDCPNCSVKFEDDLKKLGFVKEQEKNGRRK